VILQSRPNVFTFLKIVINLVIICITYKYYKVKKINKYFVYCIPMLNHCITQVNLAQMNGQKTFFFYFEADGLYPE